jgi:dolichyl-phosphate beta-glucosyltransferase
MGDALLTIVIPAFNEDRRLGPTLVRIRQYAQQSGLRCEIIIVNDGSTDATAQIVREFDPGPLTLHLLEHPACRGKGFSVRKGVLAATGDSVLICDADLSAPIEELDKLQPWLAEGHDVVIGSRDLPDSRLDPPQPWLRRMMAYAFRALRRRLLLPALRDTQCGFKLFRYSAARDVFSRQTVDGWLFDCEVLGVADRLGYRIKEVGIIWCNHPHSRVRPLREAFAAVPTLLAIRRRLKGIARR